MLLKKLLLFISIACVTAYAQGVSGVEKIVKPGDALHYYVAFDSPIKGEVTVSANLVLQTPIDGGQEGFARSWTASQSHKISETVYEVDTTVPAPNIASGLYRLTDVFIDFKQGGEKDYHFGVDFKNDNTFRIVNDQHREYPNIKSVTPDPPK
jgi:hypothetical protein